MRILNIVFNAEIKYQQYAKLRKYRHKDIRSCWLSEVTPGLLAGAEPDAHQFNVTICFKGAIKWKETQNGIISTQKLGQACMNE